MRTQVRLLVLLLLAVPLGAWLPAAGASETWTMTFSSSLNGVMNGNQIRIVSNGSADLVADQAGNFTGSGRASATIIYPPAPPVTYTPLTGEGTFSVTGKRRGDDLGFTFHSSEILCKGTMTVTTPIETITTEVEAPFDPGTLTAADNRTLIERKPGATTTHQKNPAAGLTETVSFIMGAGSDVVMQPPVDPSLFPDEPNIWTLEMELVRNWNVNRPNLQASGSSTLTGRWSFRPRWTRGLPEAKVPRWRAAPAGPQRRSR